jgi:hypothetical protein
VRLGFLPGQFPTGSAMPFWLVKVTWIEDEAEASELWEANAETAQDAVKAVTTHLRFHPHHVEARLCSADQGGLDFATDLPPGEARRFPSR